MCRIIRCKTLQTLNKSYEGFTNETVLHCADEEDNAAPLGPDSPRAEGGLRKESEPKGTTASKSGSLGCTGVHDREAVFSASPAFMRRNQK